MSDGLDNPPATDAQLDDREAMIEQWLADETRDNPAIASAERDPSTRRWFVRLRGEEKDVTTVWFTLGQRTLQYETYFMPAPEEQHAELYEYCLRRNSKLNGLSFCIGDEDAIYLRGQLGVVALDRLDLDRVLGSIFVTVERFFRPAMRIGYASRFRG
jgi:Putative bacterial sensory transduction regulator